MRSLLGITAVCVGLVAAGCAGFGPTTTAPTVDITGKWAGTWVATNPGLGSGQIEMTLKQTGSQYSGNRVVSGNEVRVMQPSNLTGSLTATADSMTGILDGVVAANVTLKRQN